MLTWNKDRKLFCPINAIGTVDLYMTANHGTENGNSPVMVHALRAARGHRGQWPRGRAPRRRCSGLSNRRPGWRITGRRTI